MSCPAGHGQHHSPQSRSSTEGCRMKNLKPYENHDASHDGVVLSAPGKIEPETASGREKEWPEAQSGGVWMKKHGKKWNNSLHRQAGLCLNFRKTD
jgi:hypothetical protein